MWERSHIVWMVHNAFLPNRMKLLVANLYWERLRRCGIASGADFLKLSEEDCATILGIHKDQRPKLFARLRQMKTESRGYQAWSAARAQQ